MPKRLAQTFIFFLLALSLGAANIASILAQALSQSASAAGQPSGLPEKLAKIEKEIEEKRKEFGIPGVAVAIVKDDKVIFQKGFGLRDVERNQPVTVDTLFGIGSSTKSFTAMAAVMSQDAGKLSLDDSPKEYLSYFRLQDPEADAKITVRDLLHHSSGLHVNDLVSYTGVLNRAEVIKVAGLAKPTAKLGEKFQYQNSMYTAAGEVVAKANGTTWEKFIEERIFKPLGMKSSDTSIREMARVADHATGYSVEDKVATKAALDDLTNIAPAGAINSNVRDMSQWVRLMLGGGVLDGKRLVSERGFNEIVTRYITVGEDFPPFVGMGYGLGWFLADRSGHHVILHPGGIDGFRAMVELVPDQKLGLIVLTNSSASPLIFTIGDIVYDNIVGKPQTITANAEPVPPQSDTGKSPALAGPSPSATIDITVDELIAKVIAAAGGEANLRRHRSTTGSATLVFENQGLTGKVAVFQQSPNLSATITTIMGLGKKIASQREYFDGGQGGVEYSFVPAERYKDEQLESTRVSSDYYEQLNWKTLYKSVTITQKSKVGDEEVYVVVKTPEKGKAVTDYISAKSFLLVKRASEGTSEETIYSDYRNVDGEMVPFGSVSQGGDMGRIVSKVQEVKFNVNIPASTFRPAVK